MVYLFLERLQLTCRMMLMIFMWPQLKVALRMDLKFLTKLMRPLLKFLAFLSSPQL
jgi:hypothetical protein